MHISQLERPAFLVSPPLSFSTAIANNAWMEKLGADKIVPNLRTAMTQWLDLYRVLSHDGMVYSLPSNPNCGLQDLVFVANLGVTLSHLERDVVILSNFTSAPRVGETVIGDRFFREMGYETVVCPHRFEGEADLKHVRDNIYVGGYGIRSEKAAYDWMAVEYGMEIIPMRMVDPFLYHLDCSIFPLSNDELIICTEMFQVAELKALEKVATLIDINKAAAYAGLTNSVRLPNCILNGSALHSMTFMEEEYRDEIAKNRRLEDIATEHGLDVVYFNLAEFEKGGGALSCLVMHLNRFSYHFVSTLSPDTAMRLKA